MIQNLETSGIDIRLGKSRPVKTPKEKLDARITSIAPKDIQHIGQHLQVQTSGAEYDPTTTTYSLIKVYVGRTMYVKTEAEAARLVKGLIRVTKPVFNAAKLLECPKL
jgi:hypothetical protein